MYLQQTIARMLTNEQQQLNNVLPEVVYCAQHAVGPHMEEKYYQHVMIRNLQRMGYTNTVYEDVFTYTFRDMLGNPMKVGHGMNARTDIELPDLKAIFELKSTTSATTDKQIAQCRNYMNHRDDIDVGYIINFISKGDDAECYTQIDTLIKTPEWDIPTEVLQFATGYDNSNRKYIRLPKVESMKLVCLNDCVIKLDNKLKDKIEKEPSKKDNKKSAERMRQRKQAIKGSNQALSLVRQLFC